MNIEAKITELLAQAEPLRAMHDDDATKTPLTAIVDQINALRAEQAKGVTEVDEDEPVKPKRGRPARQEGADA